VIECLLASHPNLPGGMDAIRDDVAGRPIATGRSDRLDPLVATWVNTSILRLHRNVLSG